VLRFYGYFKVRAEGTHQNEGRVCIPCILLISYVCCRAQESVTESNIENHRIRKVILYYYLEDDSMHVAEPRQDNSGIPQVSLVFRFQSSENGSALCSEACRLPLEPCQS
jgi:hypothetical protein